MNFIHYLIVFLLILGSCSEANELIPNDPTERNFLMGFSTWSYGPLPSDREDTYRFIQTNGDVYSEHLDDRIPWSAWINGTPLPSDFVEDIDYRVSKMNDNTALSLSISCLNIDRDDLIQDWSGAQVNYTAMNDAVIEDAYYKHVEYLVERFKPAFLISSIEANDLLKNSPTKWEAYKLLMNNVRTRLKQRFPSLPISESITLHNFFQPQVDNPSEFIQEVSDYIDQLDFVAVSFYPFFKNLHTKSEFQSAFNFLNEQTNKTIAIVETNHLSEDLIVPGLNINISSSPTEQKEYLEVLMSNAVDNDYAYIIWWAHRDYDALWETFPVEVKDLGQIWRDTGLLDENGNERPAFSIWKTGFQK